MQLAKLNVTVASSSEINLEWLVGNMTSALRPAIKMRLIIQPLTCVRTAGDLSRRWIRQVDIYTLATTHT